VGLALHSACVFRFESSWQSAFVRYFVDLGYYNLVIISLALQSVSLCYRRSYEIGRPVTPEVDNPTHTCK
jgi:hypothetical protein